MVEKLKKISNKKIVILTSIVMLLVLIASVSYAIWSRSFTQTGTNLSKYDCFDIVYAENVNEVSLSNGYPITDEEGLKAESYDLTIKNTCKILANYEVVLNKLNTSTLNDTNVKIAVDSDISLLSDLKTTNTNLTNATEGKVLTTGILANGQSKTIKIQSWMDENTTKTEGAGKSFSYKVTAEATTGVSSKSLIKLALNSNKIYDNAPSNFRTMEPGSTSYVENEGVEKEYSAEAVNQLKLASSSTTTLGTGYTFDAKTGLYTLTGTASGTFEKDKYYCKDTTKCMTVYKIVTTKTVSDYQYITKAIEYGSKSTTETASGIYKTIDEDGTTYYNRGEIKNNYVYFANNLWRIMRINGDGSIRMISESSIGQSSFNDLSKFNDGQEYVYGYTYNNSKPNAGDGNPSTVKTFVEKWYNANLASYNDKIALSKFINDIGIGETYDDPLRYVYIRYNDASRNPTYLYSGREATFGGKYNLKIGLPTMDDITFAGTYYSNDYNYRFYLNGTSSFMTMTPETYWSTDVVGSTIVAYNQNQLLDNFIGSRMMIRPVINLKSNTLIASGDGSLSNPYVIE